MRQLMTLDQIQKLPFFFILGRPRSGTTLLRTLLDAHPNVIIPLENSGLIHLYFKYRKINDWDSSLLESILTDMKSLIRIESWNIDWEGIRSFLLEGDNNALTFPLIIKIVYAHFRSEFEKENIICLGDKTPLISLYGNEIFKAFPEAIFIHLVRDYRANLASMSKHNVFSPSTTGKVMQWKKSLLQISNLAEKHPNKYMQIRYEDLVSQPENTFQTICEFIGIPFLPELLDAGSRKNELDKIYNAKFITDWQPNLSGNISTENINKWKDSLSTRSIRKAEYIAGDAGRRFQYKPLSGKMGIFFILEMEIKKLLFHLNEINRYIYDRLPHRMKLRIKNRKFKLTDNLIKWYQKQIEGK